MDYPNIEEPSKHVKHGKVPIVRPIQAYVCTRRHGAPALFTTDWLIGAYISLYGWEGFSTPDTKRIALALVEKELSRRGIPFTRGNADV